MQAAVRAALIAASLLVAGPRVALPCECREARPRLLLPRSGARDVPTNSRVLVSPVLLGLQPSAGADGAAPPRLRLRRRGGGAVAAPLSTMRSQSFGVVFVLTPDEPLAPGTPYELTLEERGPRRRLIGRFTTGRGPDTRAPAFAGIERLRAVVSRRPAAGPCDRPPPVALLSWDYGVGRDDRTPARELVRVVNVQPRGLAATPRLLEVGAAGGRHGVGGSECDPFSLDLSEGSQVCASVELIDLAGNGAGATTERCTTVARE